MVKVASACIALHKNTKNIELAGTKVAKLQHTTSAVTEIVGEPVSNPMITQSGKENSKKIHTLF